MSEKVEKELKRLEIELAMGGFHDGWCLQWIREKIEELKKIKDGNNSILNQKSK